MSIPREMDEALTLIRELIRELDKRAVAHYENYHPKYSHIAECLICGETGEEYQHTHKVDCILPRAAAFTHDPLAAARDEPVDDENALLDNIEEILYEQGFDGWNFHDSEDTDNRLGRAAYRVWMLVRDFYGEAERGEETPK